MNFHRFAAGLVGMTVVWVAAGGIAAELVANGDFETDAELFVTWPGYVGGENPPDIPEWFGIGGRGINPVQPREGDNPPELPGWQGGGQRGLNPIVNPEVEDPAPFRDNGDNLTSVAFLQGTAFLRQQIEGLTAGGNYVLSLEYNARNCCGDFPLAQLSLNGNPVSDFPDPDLFFGGGVTPVGEDNPWYHAEIPFTAERSSLELLIATEPEFGGDSTLLLDNIHLLPEAGGTDLVVNGDFEADAELFTQWPGYLGDEARLSPFRDNGANKTSVAFLQGAASLEQEVTGLTVGEEYVLKLDYNARNCCGDSPIAEILLNNQLLDDFPGPEHPDGVIEAVGGDASWYRYEHRFVAEQETATLMISTYPANGGDSTFLIDNVSIALPSSPGDFDGNGSLDVADIDALSQVILGGSNLPGFDLNADGIVNRTDHQVWVEQLKGTYLGDANLDGEFNSSDFVQVFQAGQYEDSLAANSTWATGDWNADAEFNSSDFVAAFQGGGFEQGPRGATQAVPEPHGLLLLTIGLLALSRRRHFT